MAVTPFPIYSFEKNVKPKEHPVRINYPVNISDSIIYKFDFTTAYQSKLPNDTDIKTKYGRYKQCFFTEQNQVILQRQFQLFTGTYPIEEYGDFQSFIDLVMDTQQKSVIILNPN